MYSYHNRIKQRIRAGVCDGVQTLVKLTQVLAEAKRELEGVLEEARRPTIEAAEGSPFESKPRRRATLPKRLNK